MYLLNLDGAEHGIVAEPATATTGLIGSSHLAQPGSMDAKA